MKYLISNWKAFLFGGMAGVALMWLIAPMTGEETRSILSKNLSEAQDRANAVFEDAQGKVRQISDIGRRVVEEQKTSLERGADQVRSVTKDLKSTVSGS